ncbi:MAG: 1,4-alpha-glucan branching protein GlgB [Clostridia bacterium]|nr:1,4-alpha-glucan branching protein GlgB [Clostridia bacterium]
MGFFIDNTEVYLFMEGTNAYSYKMLGNHRVHGEYEAVRFGVYAPNASEVSVVGSFNKWDINADKMQPIRNTGIFETHIGHAVSGDIYKYAIKTKDGKIIYKSDPYAVRTQMPPDTASMVWEVEEYDWTDSEYLKKRAKRNPYKTAMCIYEVHTGSWRIGERLFELSESLVKYVSDMGFTHIELMPVSEFPYENSWGYQITGFFAISTRYGTPYDLKHFINCCHMKNIGVIIDWVPAHFPRDEHGLARFDGEPLYESSDALRSDQPDWGTLLFDYSKPHVRSFLLSNAVYLLHEYHADGLRVDAVSCMLYHDYGKRGKAWRPNKYGGRENLEAIEFLRTLAKTVNRECEGVILAAEESTAFPLVTKPPEVGGLGFNFKWNMGFMNDTLEYIGMDSYFRKFNHDKLTFSMYYAFSENYILPFSHDETVHGKKSLIERMHGSYDEKFAQLRLLYMYLYAHPGKKLMFMGDEIAQFNEWDMKRGVEFDLTGYERHAQMQGFVKKLNHLYRRYPQFWACDTGWDGFKWLICDDKERSLIVFLRQDKKRKMICIFNFTPVDYNAYEIPVQTPMKALSVFSSDSAEFGGSGKSDGQFAVSRKKDGECIISVDIPAYAGIYMLVMPG